MRAKVTHLQPLAHHPDMDADRLAEAHRLLAECAAAPDDPKARAVARWVQQTMDARPDDPIAARMRGLLSDYALAIVDGDADRQRAVTLALRREIAGALVPDGGQIH